MQRRWSYGALILAATVVVAGCDLSGAGEASIPDSDGQGFLPDAMDPATMAALMEMQEIQQKLEPIERRALEDEALADQLMTLTDRINSGMEEENGDLLQRVEDFQARLVAAETAGDQDGMERLLLEAQGLQQELQALQSAVLNRPDIRAEVDEFEAAHRARMVALDPDAQALLDRIDEILASIGR